MIEPEHEKLSIARQCELTGISRSSWYYRPCGESDLNLRLMCLIDAQYLKTCWYGSRQMARYLRRLGHFVGRKRVRRLMCLMGLRSVAPQPHTSRPAPQHQVYAYLLRDRTIERANQVWCADVTYLPMAHGFLYLVAIMDWHSRKVLTFRLSNTQDTAFCVEALAAALERYGRPEIFNTDQGSQFTSRDWIDVLKRHNIQISMDSKGQWLDNVFIERLWRSLKYECVYLNAFQSFKDAHRQIRDWIDYYNDRRPHSKLHDLTPSEVYTGIRPLTLAA
jgi:putative transposase